jgi:hypothetical protein
LSRYLSYLIALLSLPARSPMLYTERVNSR